tara:strand:- start:744 stop:1259 length:516 start_codon:yes stop_codon:yes gene_type:complete
MDEKIDIATNNIITAYLAQIDSAMKISEIISDHDSMTDEIRPDDVICGLIYRLMVPMTIDEMNSSLKAATDIMNEESNDDDDYDYDDDDVSSDNESGYNSDSSSDTHNELYPSIINDGPKRKVIVNNCNCEICSKVRECINNYHNHEPNDPLATRFRDSITEACTKHNLYI